MQFAADVLDVLLEHQDALGVTQLAAFQLEEIEAFQQLTMHPQFEIGHDRAEVRFELATADRAGLFGLER